MDDVRGRFLGLPHGTTPAAVTTNKNIIMSYNNELYIIRAVETFKRNRVGQTRVILKVCSHFQNMHLLPKSNELLYIRVRLAHNAVLIYKMVLLKVRTFCILDRLFKIILLKNEK